MTFAVAPHSAFAALALLAALSWPGGPGLLGAGAKQAASGLGRMLSEEPRIELRSGFVPAADLEAIRRLAEKMGFSEVEEGRGDVNGGEEFVYLNRSFAEGKAANDSTHEGWAASERFAAAAAEWAGIPSANATPVVTRWESWAPGSHLNRSGLLHLDSRLRPHLRSTVLAYMGSSRGGKGGDGANGGFTVFPCIETDDMDAKELARRQKLCSRAHRHLQHAQEKLLAVYEEGMQLDPDEQYAFLERHPELTGMPKLLADGVRPVNWHWTAAHDAVAASSPGSLRADPLFELAEAMCRGKAPGVRIAPAPGSAVLLEAASVGKKGELVPNWQLWHTGCSPLRGQGRRWTLQLFLEGGGAAESAAAESCKSPAAGKKASAECSERKSF